jgi:hypothetical protein
MTPYEFANGRFAGNRISDAATPSAAAASGPPTPSHAFGSIFPVQAPTTAIVLPHFGFQPLPTPTGTSPFRFDLVQLLSDTAIQQITRAGKMVFHAIGDTGDQRGTQVQFVADMMTQDYDASQPGEVPAFCYHLGDVVYFAGDIEKYGDCFYEPYSEYPSLIVAIAGNHDCQPDDPQDGPVDPTKKPLDGWVQNFMSSTPNQLGSFKTSSARTLMDLPNVYWTFTTPFATIIGLFSNVSETEADIREPQLQWFNDELQAAAASDPNKALIVAIHHPPYSGDDEHSGSSKAEDILFSAFRATNVYPHLILSGHVHDYQRFTVKEVGDKQIACIVSGNGGYTRLGRLRTIGGKPPARPLQLTSTLRLENYDDTNFGFIRFEVSAEAIVGKNYSAPFVPSAAPKMTVSDTFIIDLATRSITTP